MPTIPDPVKSLIEQLADVHTRDQEISRVFLEDRTKLYAEGGEIFSNILAIEVKADEKATASSTFDKYATKGKLGGYGKTVVTSQMLELFKATKGNGKTIDTLVKQFRTVGIEGKHRADGTMPERVDFVADLARAKADGRYDAKTGKITAAKTGGKAKTKKAKRDEADAAIGEFAEMWGDAFDLRYFTDEELTALEAAMRVERKRRQLGGKAKVA